MNNMKLNLKFMAAPFGPVVASNSGSDTSEECHPCGRVGEGSGVEPGVGWMDGWAAETEIAEAFKQVN